MQASLTAGVPDHVPVAQRGAVSGWIGLPQTFGVVLAVALVTVAVTGNAGYLLIAVLVVACALPFALATPGPAAGPGRPAAVCLAGLRPLVLGQPAAPPGFRLGLADQVRGQPGQRDGRAVPAVLPARPAALQPPVPGPDGPGRPAHPDLDLPGHDRADRGDRRHRLGPDRPPQVPGHRGRAGHGGSPRSCSRCGHPGRWPSPRPR